VNLDFLSPALAEPAPRSPLARALEGSDVRDLSLASGVLDVRGDLAGHEMEGVEVVRLSAGRSLVLCPYRDAPALRAWLEARGVLAVDVSGGYAGLEVEGEAVLRRLTELPLDRLPAVGAVGHVSTLVLREGDRFRLFFRQEYADSMGELVRDALEGLA
jgi:sarcosine oxidase gamma subunit